MNRSEQLFEDRYGPGSFRRLSTMLEEPCPTFAAIASHFGVTRERVRQWHLRLCPGAPRGHERKRLCMMQRRKRALLRQPLFRAFYRHARAHFAPGRFSLIATRDGLRTRAVRLDGHVVAIREARVKHRKNATSYRLAGSAAAVDFVYYQLGEQDFLFIPRKKLPAGEATYRRDGASPYEPFHNTFAAGAQGKERHASADVGLASHQF